jgi:hypothetical protein
VLLQIKTNTQEAKTMMNHPNIKVIERQALTTREVSAAYGIAVGTLNNWRCQRVGPPFYRLNGRKIVYFRDDLAAWARREPILTRDSVEAKSEIVPDRGK